MLRSQLFFALFAATFTFAGCAAQDTDETQDADGQDADGPDGDKEFNVIDGAGTGVSAKVFDTGSDGLNVRNKPSTSGAVIAHLADGAKVTIKCQVSGSSVNGNTVWDYLKGYNGYVTDNYVWTGYDGFIPGVPKCGGGSSPSPSPDGSLGAAAVAEARNHLGYQEYNGNCNMFSTALGADCEEWCADFIRYVWGKVGANTSGLTGYSMTFHDYGKAHGTWKSVASGALPKVGDAVIWGATDFSWGAHVGMVTEVSGSSFKTIHGNFDVQGNGTGDDIVKETDFVTTSYEAGTGYPMLGFISPVK